ncbi:hypothetical protein L7F22_032652 [Adiantum nelumboides]|nr:hypothetical protein [Adiantum nelumboides]
MHNSAQTRFTSEVPAIGIAQLQKDLAQQVLDKKGQEMEEFGRNKLPPIDKETNWEGGFQTSPQDEDLILIAEQEVQLVTIGTNAELTIYQSDNGRYYKLLEDQRKNETHHQTKQAPIMVFKYTHAIKMTYVFKDALGRIYNRKQLLLWNSATQQAASFNCSFSFSIVLINDSPPADGMAFFLLDPKLSDVPNERKGSGLGLPLNTHSTGFIAIEFDTYLNSQIHYRDNHIGIDVNSVVSAKYVNLSFGLINSSFVYSGVDYSSNNSMLEVYATNLSSTKPTSPVLTFSIILTQFLPQSVLIGFSAATGGKAEFHHMHSWSFISTSIAKLEKASSKVSLIAGLVSAGSTVVGIVFLALFLLPKRRLRQRLKDLLPSQIPRSALPTPEDADLGPQKFSYRSLNIATNSFGDNCLLGKGGFGSVYRGLLPNAGREVAVKCISTHGQREFLAELSIISRIRHKNLVQLEGWCRDKSRSQLLLVYEYLPNGSLYRSLFSKTSSSILNWNKRFNIICGLGSAIQYLHQECERVIVHRDIKAID